jgi:hypothetical protein
MWRRALAVIAVAGLAGCHLLLPFGDEPPPDSPSKCISSSFGADTDLQRLELVQGNWTWASGAVHQSLVDNHGALAVLRGSTDVVNGAPFFRATTTFKAIDLFQNGYPQGGGLSLLLARNRIPGNPDRQITCTATALPGAASTHVGVFSWNGQTKAPDELGLDSLAGLSLVGSAATLTMEITRSGKSWSMVCALTDDASRVVSTSADISALVGGYVPSTEVGVGLFTSGAEADFLDVSLCY